MEQIKGGRHAGGRRSGNRFDTKDGRSPRLGGEIRFGARMAGAAGAGAGTRSFFGGNEPGPFRARAGGVAGFVRLRWEAAFSASALARQQGGSVSSASAGGRAATGAAKAQQTNRVSDQRSEAEDKNQTHHGSPLFVRRERRLFKPIPSPRARAMACPGSTLAGHLKTESTRKLSGVAFDPCSLFRQSRHRKAIGRR